MADMINISRKSSNQAVAWLSLTKMASSSVSQEDVENDYEKLEKRSRIRTARARQINPQVNLFSSTVNKIQ